jgi:hypothetical protein
MKREPGTRQPEYVSFLVRLWRVSDEGGPTWRATLQRPGTAVVMGFPSLEELFAFLRAETSGWQPEAAAGTSRRPRAGSPLRCELTNDE